MKGEGEKEKDNEEESVTVEYRTVEVRDKTA